MFNIAGQDKNCSTGKLDDYDMMILRVEQAKQMQVIVGAEIPKLEELMKRKASIWTGKRHAYIVQDDKSSVMVLTVF